MRPKLSIILLLFQPSALQFDTQSRFSVSEASKKLSGSLSEMRLKSGGSDYQTATRYHPFNAAETLDTVAKTEQYQMALTHCFVGANLIV